MECWSKVPKVWDAFPLSVTVTFWTFELVAGETPAVLSTSRNVKKTLMAPQTTNKQNNDMHMCESVTTRTGYD